MDTPKQDRNRRTRIFVELFSLLLLAWLLGLFTTDLYRGGKSFVKSLITKPAPAKTAVVLTPEEEYEIATRVYEAKRVAVLTDRQLSQNKDIAGIREKEWAQTIFNLSPTTWVREKAFYLAVNYAYGGDAYPVAWGVGTYNGRRFEWFGYMSGKGALMLDLSIAGVPKMPESMRSAWENTWCLAPEKKDCAASGAFDDYVLEKAKKLPGFTFQTKGHFPAPPSSH